MRKFKCSLCAILSATIISLGLSSCGEEELEYGNEYEEIVDDDGVPSGTPGNESMFGIYSYLGTNSDIWKSLKETAESNVTYHNGDRSYWQNHYFENSAIWIVDEKTIYWVSDYMGFYESRPTSDNESILLEYEPYTVSYSKVVAGRRYSYTANYYLTHYVSTVRNTNKWEGRYAMNGSKMIVHTDETTKWENGHEYVAVDYNTLTWEYSDGTITDAGGVKYVKIN